MAQDNTKRKSVPMSEYVFMLSKHKLLILCCFILGTFGAVLIFKITPSGYETTAKLTIQSVLPKGKNDQEFADSAFNREVNLNTHQLLLLSRPVLEKLINRLASKHQPDEQDAGRIGRSRTQETVQNVDQIISQMKKNFSLLIGKPQRPLSPAEQLAARIEALRGKITLETIIYTNIMKITVQDTDPIMARDIANTLAETYVQYDINVNQQASTNSFTFLKEQAAEFKAKLDAAEAEFLGYKRQVHLFSLTGIQEGITAKISQYDLLLIEAEGKLQQLITRLNELESLAAAKKPDAVRLRSLLENSVINKLNDQLIAAELEHSDLAKIYRDKHLKIQTIQAKIQNLRKEIHRQMDKELANMRQMKKLLQTEVNELKRNIEELKKEALAVNKKEQQYLLLERNVETYRNYYNTMMSRIEAVSLNSDIRDTVTAVNFVERAERPLYPVKPDAKKIFLAGILGGILGGIGLALLLELSDRTVRTEEDVAHYFDLPVVGVIPIAEQAIHRHSYRTASFNPQEGQ